MKSLFPVYVLYIFLLGFIGCGNKKEAEEIIPETALQIQQRLIQGTWKVKEGSLQEIDKNGTVIRFVPTQPFIGDKTTYTFTSRERIVNYDPLYSRPPATNAYTITEKNGKFYLEMGKLLYQRDPDATYIIEFIAGESTILEDKEVKYPDGSRDIIQHIYVKVP